jgi:hypothetical protein
MISVLKENSVATWIESIAFDGSNRRNPALYAVNIPASV